MNCLHCGSDKVEKVMDEAMAMWVKCLKCKKESILGSSNSPTRLEAKLY